MQRIGFQFIVQKLKHLLTLITDQVKSSRSHRRKVRIALLKNFHYSVSGIRCLRSEFTECIDRGRVKGLETRTFPVPHPSFRVLIRFVKKIREHRHKFHWIEIESTEHADSIRTVGCVVRFPEEPFVVRDDIHGVFIRQSTGFRAMPAIPYQCAVFSENIDSTVLNNFIQQMEFSFNRTIRENVVV